MKNEWNKLKNILPEENRLLECTTSSGDVVELIRRGDLFFAGNIYVYYVPVMWRYKES